MRDYRKFISLMLLAFVVAVGWTDTARAEISGLPPVRESEAFQQYKKRTPSELSRILYLIERFKGTTTEVLYDGTFYKSDVAVPIARWFLAVNYKKQTAEQWVKQYCTSTIFYGNPIRVKLPDSTFRTSRDLLLEELADLKKTEDEQRPV